jgi:peptide/nickel transport system substrate-binding protein
MCWPERCSSRWDATSRWIRRSKEVGLSGWIVVFPQFIDANPAVVTNLQFRRALMHGIDRQQMADTLMSGVVPIAHTFVSSDSELYRSIEPEIVKYDFDPRRATAMIQELGYSKGADGTFRDSADRPLNIELRASASRDLNQKAILAITALWQQLGIPAEPMIIPQQRARDREYVQTFPAFILYNQPTDLNSLLRHRGSNTPLASNNYVGDNNSRYMNPEFDALIERYFSTIPTQERTAALGKVVNHMTANLTVLPMFYNAETGMVSHRVQNASGRRGEGASQTWNVLQWDVAP